MTEATGTEVAVVPAAPASSLSTAAAAWMRQVRDYNGAIDMTGYRLRLLDRMRAAIRRRDLFVEPSFRYSDPRKGLLEGAAWEAPVPPCAAHSECRVRGATSCSASANGSIKRSGRRPRTSLKMRACGSKRPLAILT
jgi:hypothetical protein